MRLFLVLLFSFAVLPRVAFGQDTVIVPQAPPPPSTNWEGLVTLGAFYVFSGVTAVKQSVPWFKGWKVPAILVPVAALAVSFYQVGPSDLALLGKHAGVLFVTTYG